MVDQLQIDNKPKDQLVNIERTLPKLLEKTAANANLQLELTTKAERLPELKKEFADAEKRYNDLKMEIGQTNKRVRQLNRKFEPLYAILYDEIQQVWKESKRLFLVLTILIAMVIALIAFAALRDIDNELLTMEVGFIIIFIIFMIQPSKYRSTFGYLVLAIFLLIGSGHVSNDPLKWTLVSLALGIVALAIGIRAFQTGEDIDSKVDKIISKLENTPNKLPAEAGENREGDK
jgi:hypothetical protein